jgi:hypothetical protein
MSLGTTIPLTNMLIKDFVYELNSGDRFNTDEIDFDFNEIPYIHVFNYK